MVHDHVFLFPIVLAILNEKENRIPNNDVAKYGM